MFSVPSLKVIGGVYLSPKYLYTLTTFTWAASGPLGLVQALLRELQLASQGTSLPPPVTRGALPSARSVWTPFRPPAPADGPRVSAHV